MDKVDSGVINLFKVIINDKLYNDGINYKSSHLQEYKNQNTVIKELRETNEKLLNENYRMKAQINELGQQLQENIGQTLNAESAHVSYINLRGNY